jgi:glycosyltransferase involved in cell wall biosynthesis
VKMNATGSRDDGRSAFPLLVHSHLRWDFVWQRPQQILSRLARRHPVLFVEEPILHDDGTAWLELSHPLPRLVRAIPHLPRRDHDSALSDVLVRSLLQEALSPGGSLAAQFARPVQWFYTPMPAPVMLGAFEERGVVYDCMDELSKFRFAPTDIVRRERLLLDEADIVFTGGYSLFRSKARYHDNVHFFGCGVEVDHFAKARAESTTVPDDLAALQKPILGYFGVIDERLDYELIARLADANPNWTVAMIGPVVKVDPDSLPKRENIAWLGGRPYADLPACVKAFDVCLMPFALNEATEYINPTKTLEYMATGKPIVSTAVADVIHNFGSVVAIAHDGDEFVRLCERACTSPDRARIEAGLSMAGANSWDAIVGEMRALLVQAVEPPLERALVATRDVPLRDGSTSNGANGRTRTRPTAREDKDSFAPEAH